MKDGIVIGVAEQGRRLMMVFAGDYATTSGNIRTAPQRTEQSHKSILKEWLSVEDRVFRSFNGGVIQ